MGYPLSLTVSRNIITSDTHCNLHLIIAGIKMVYLKLILKRKEAPMKTKVKIWQINFFREISDIVYFNSK